MSQLSRLHHIHISTHRFALQIPQQRLVKLLRTLEWVHGGRQQILISPHITLSGALKAIVEDIQQEKIVGVKVELVQAAVVAASVLVPQAKK